MKIALINENSQAAKNELVESVLKKVVEPMGHEVVNYGMYSDTLPHLHVHVVPKYQDGPDWGGPFRDDRPAQLLPEEEYERRIKWIRSALNGGLPAEDL